MSDNYITKLQITFYNIAIEKLRVAFLGCNVALLCSSEPLEVMPYQTYQTKPRNLLVSTCCGGKIKLAFDCVESNYLLKWEFRTFDHDIRFGVKRVNKKTGEESIEIVLQRVASHQLDEEGFITCQKDCTYHVLFDNTYSYFKGKRIRYAVSLVKAQNVAELEAAADEIANS